MVKCYEGEYIRDVWGVLMPWTISKIQKYKLDRNTEASRIIEIADNITQQIGLAIPGSWAINESTDNIRHRRTIFSFVGVTQTWK